MWLKIGIIHEAGHTAYGERPRTPTGKRRKPLVYPNMAWIVFDKSRLAKPYGPGDFDNPQDAATILGKFETCEECHDFIRKLESEGTR